MRTSGLAGLTLTPSPAHENSLEAWAAWHGPRLRRSVPGGGLRFAFYGRVSTEDHQDPVTSRARQLDQAAPLVGEFGWIVAEFFDTVREILANPRYTGRQVWNRQPTSHELIDPVNTGLGHRQVQRWAQPDGWVISARPSHPALVSEEDFIAVQGIRAERGNGGTAGGHRYLLAGLLRCAICGRRMESCWANNRPAYRCRHGYSSAVTPDPARLKNLYIREDQILPHLPALSSALATAAPADGRRRRRTRRGIEVAHPVSAEDAIGHLRSRQITVTYDPQAKTLQADTPEAVTTVIGRAS